ncbi:MAG: FMN-binding protein [Gemmatimonadaceae bacterium]|nr:FMN-binding protein [Gemmatimonadaceae bacterium]
MTLAHGATPPAGPPAGPPAVPPPPVPDAGTPSWRLLATLGGAGALAGLLLVTAWEWTTPTITANRARVEQAAVAEVLREPARVDTLYLENGALTRTPRGDAAKLERAYQGFDHAGLRVGVAIRGAEPGFSDVITVLIGFDPTTSQLLGMKVLGQKETPGLGDKIEKDSGFVGQFSEARAPLRAVKARGGKDPTEVATITGATISSRTVIRIINHAVERWQPLLVRFDREPGQ